MLLKRRCTPDGQGGYCETWTEVGTCWASLENCSRRRASLPFLEGQRAGTVRPADPLYRVEVRLGGPETFERVRGRDQTFAVVSAFEKNRLSGRLSFFVTAVPWDQEKEQDDA